MTTSKVVQVLTSLLVISTFAVAAGSDILYATYDPSNNAVTFQTKVEAMTFAGNQNIYGAQFTPTTTGTVDSLTAAIAVNFIGAGQGPGSNQATFQFKLFAGSAGAVDPFNDTPIDTFSQTINTPGDVITSFTFASTNNPVLTAGQLYWIYMGTSPGGAQPLDWGVPSSNGVQGVVDDASSAAGFPTVHMESSTTQPAFVIDGTKIIGDAPFQVSYAANLNIGESYLNFCNDGANGAPLLGSGFGNASGNICLNVYAFDPGEELVSCCSCLITPDQCVNLGANRDLTSRTLTGVVPTSVTVKLLATLAGAGGSGTSCNSSAATVTSATLVAGIDAYRTTLHAQGTGYATTETPFTGSTLSPAELASISGRCASILGNASGFGICSSCRAGALGGSKF